MDRNYYSQHGEDYILSEMLKGQTTGCFVEIGCIDGRRFSNTLTFEESGWNGVCVEAHSDYIPLLKANRPGAEICHCAVSDRDLDAVTFYANKRGSLSTLNPSKENEFKSRFGRWFTGFETQTIPQLCLNTIFERYHIHNPDILSIDVEGEEALVLAGLDLIHHHPRIMVIEADSIQDEKKLDARLIPAGYVKSVRLVNNLFYVLDSSLENSLFNRDHHGMLIHTQHPLDSDGDQFVPFRYCFRQKSCHHLGVPD
ncbi:MAG: FkbM family methyltransferase [Candidatus Delongbacteria bacterium]|nr:FkbM family methyltransferase [Candidatus Delongbacteria bacterium]